MADFFFLGLKDTPSSSNRVRISSKQKKNGAEIEMTLIRRMSTETGDEDKHRKRQT